VANRVPRLSATFGRSLSSIGIEPRSPAHRAVFAAIGKLASSELLPGAGDLETTFAPSLAYVRRVTGHNVWLLYRFDDRYVYLLTARDIPPIPAPDR
jgi:hypothetical protein